MTDRRATVVWEGTLAQGRGTLDLGSKVLAGARVTWASRVEEPSGMTSPEEMLAAAEAECYAMVLTSMLSREGHVPKRLEVRATCTVDRDGTTLKITTMRLDVRADVADVTQQRFEALTAEAERTCPVSSALRGNVQILVEAVLLPAETA